MKTELNRGDAETRSKQDVFLDFHEGPLDGESSQEKSPAGFLPIGHLILVRDYNTFRLHKYRITGELFKGRQSAAYEA